MLTRENYDITYNITTDESKSGESNPFYGKSHTPETKKRIGDANRGKRNTLQGKTISINGTTYQSISQASRSTGYSLKLIKTRRADPSWPDWFEQIGPT